MSVLNSEPSFLCEVSPFNKELHCYVLTTSVQEAIVGGTRQRFSLIGPLQSRDHCKALIYCQSISSCLSQHNLYCENSILLYNSRQDFTFEYNNFQSLFIYLFVLVFKEAVTLWAGQGFCEPEWRSASKIIGV